MVSARLRGIYSLPLAGVLRDRGHEIVQPTEEIQRYLGVEETIAPPDVTVGKGNSRHEVMLSGDSESMEAVIDDLSDEFLDLGVKRFDFALNSIYRGTVVNVNPDRRAAFVDLGPTDGFLPFRNTRKRLREGEELTVKIVELPTDPDENPVLTTDISYANDYAVLLSRGVKMSKAIRDRDERERLYDLGHSIETDRGILWRTAARDVRDEFLRGQVEDLVDVADRVEKRAGRSVAPELLQEGSPASTLLVPGFTKRHLDELRAEVAPTVTKHHKHKAADRSHDLAVEAVEQLTDDESLLERFDSVMGEIEPVKVGDSLRFTHLKPDGSSPSFGRGRVIDVEEGEIQLQRDIEGGIKGLPSENADYAVTSVEEGSWMIISEYFTEEGDSTGMYININTPVEVYPWEVRYMDLCVDVLVQDSEVEVLDTGELDGHVSEGRISPELAERARDAAADIMEEITGS
ncbi:MAG: RNA-binding protein AU-1 [Methanonatronarchaeales archaeon]|nr:RNA-binding protein AU-1 [Methanonatronarchaeales archaeon]